MNVFYYVQHQLFQHYRKKGPKSLVYFESFHGKHYSDNPRAIYEQLKVQHPEVQCVWGVKKGYEAPFKEENVPFVYRFTPKWYAALAQAKVWCINNRTKAWLEKSPFTTYIQTWHGTPLKKLGLDIAEVHITGETTAHYHESVREETALWDCLLSPSTYASHCFETAFALEESQLRPYGYPRNDFLVALAKGEPVAKQKVRALKKKLHLPKQKQIVLYAPTWRDHLGQKDGRYQPALPFDFATFERKFGDRYCLLVRQHYLVGAQVDCSAYPSIIDVSSYEEMSHLLALADALITDYSSCMFDYALLGRPLYFYMYDQDLYESGIRGTYFSAEQSLPGPILRTEEELWSSLQVGLHISSCYEKKYKDFQQRFNEFDKGRATEQTIDAIMELLNK